MTTGKTYTFDVNLDKKTITIEDRICRISFLLEVDQDGLPREPWIGQRIMAMFINGRGVSTRRDMNYLGYLEKEAREAGKNYLRINYKQKESASEKEPYWLKKPF